MRRNDIVSGILILTLGIAVAGYSRTFPPMPGQDIGPALFPGLIGVGLAVCGGVLLWRSVRRPQPARAAEAWWREPPRLLRFIVLLGAVVFYAIAVETAGFFVTAFVFLFALLVAFGARSRWTMPVAAAVTAALHFVFYTLLRVPLPWGWLEPIAW